MANATLTPIKFFLLNVKAAGSNFSSLQENGAAPTAAQTSGWTPGNTGTGSAYSPWKALTKQAIGTFTSTVHPDGSLDNTNGDSWRSEGRLKGTFGASVWNFNLVLRSVTAAYTGRGQLRFRVYRGANADGSSAVELTSGTIVSTATSASLSTTVDTTVTATWSPGSFSLDNEYLFFEVAWQITSAGGGTTQDVLPRVNNTTITTASFDGIQFRSSTTKAAGSGTSIIINKPASVVAGDVLVAIINTDSTASALLLAGWTQQVTDVSGATAEVWILTKVVDGTEGSSFTFTWTGSSGNSGVMLAYINVDQILPIDVSAHTNTSGTSLAIGAVTATNAYERLVTGIADWTSGAATAPANVVARASVTTTTITLSYDEQLGGSGSTGTRTFTVPTGGSAGGHIALTRDFQVGGRVATIGFELDTLAADVEITTPNIASGTASVLSTTQAHSGTYSTKYNTSSSFSIDSYQFSGGTGVAFARIYFYFSGYPSANCTLACFFDSGGTNLLGGAYMNSSGQVGVVYQVGASATYGSTLSSAVSQNSWHYIEIGTDASIANVQTVVVNLDGVQIDSKTGSITEAANLIAELDWGAFLIGTESGTISNLYVDDIAINIPVGGVQSSYPGAATVTYLRPNADGDNHAFTVQIGGTVGATNNYTRVNETPPDDITSYNGDVTGGDIDDFNVDDTPGAIGSGDTISLVQVGVRYRAAVASAEANFKLRLKKTTSGNVFKSAAITPNATTWKSNQNAIPRIPPITTYNNPDGVAWTKTTLDSLQAGYEIVTTNTNAFDASALWVIVESIPSSNPTINVSDTTTITESVTVSENHYEINVSDSTTTADTPTLSLRSYISVSDSTTGVDVPTLSMVSNVSVSDSTTGVDVPTLKLTSYVSVSDSTTIAEVVTLLIPILYISVSDSTTIAETITTSPTSYINVSDNSTATESVSVTIITNSSSLSINVSDSTTINETVTLSLTSYISSSDSTTGVDTPTISKVSNINVLDSTTATETIIMSLTSNINVVDSTTIVESNILSPVSYVNLVDSTLITESVVIYEDHYEVNVSDATTGIDNLTVNLNPQISVMDSTTIVDIPTISLTSYINVADFTTAVELITLLIPILFINVTDSTTAVDIVIEQEQQLDISVSDLTIITESTSFDIYYPLIVSDLTIITESISTFYPILTVGVFDTFGTPPPRIIYIDPEGRLGLRLGGIIYEKI